MDYAWEEMRPTYFIKTTTGKIRKIKSIIQNNGEEEKEETKPKQYNFQESMRIREHQLSRKNCSIM